MNLEYTSTHRHLITIEMIFSKTNYIMSKILVLSYFSFSVTVTDSRLSVLYQLIIPLNQFIIIFDARY